MTSKFSIDYKLTSRIWQVFQSQPHQGHAGLEKVGPSYRALKRMMSSKNMGKNERIIEQEQSNILYMRIHSATTNRKHKLLK